MDKSNVADFDVIALQEPWRNTYHNTTFHPRKDIFELAYMDDPLTRVCFYINKMIALASWTVKFHSPDLCTLRIQTTTNRVLHIHNVYNPTAASEEPSKIPLLQTILENSPLDEHMVLGDFNLPCPAGANKHHYLFRRPWKVESPIQQNLFFFFFFPPRLALSQRFPFLSVSNGIFLTMLHYRLSTSNYS